jgi:predicted AAA+ superfamily ATPase
VRPLSFAEFLAFRQKPAAPDDAEFQTYLRYGGLPGLHSLASLNDVSFRPFVTSIFDTIMLKDIVVRNQVRNVPLLERVARFVMDNTGNLLNASRIVAFLKSRQTKASVDTILSQLRWFNEAWLTERALIYDIKGKRHLETNEKHYLGDFGLKHAVLGWRPADISGLLENVVFLELRRRGWAVSVGRVGEWEIDFVGERGGERAYWQVTARLDNEKIIGRETRSLLALEDNYPKTILTMDKLATGDHEGIAIKNLPEWLLSEE